MARARETTLPPLSYTEPKRREILRILRLRAEGKVDITDAALLSRHRLQPRRMREYLALWGRGEDLTGLAEGATPGSHDVLS